MPEMGKYCKAYLLKQMREYPGWNERAEHLPHQLEDDSIVYLQENYVVTAGIFKDVHIIFDNVTDEWKEYCHGVLNFEIPVYEPITIPKASGSSEET